MNRKLRLVPLLALSAAFLLIVGAVIRLNGSRQPRFNGSRLLISDQYHIEFTRMNQTDEAVLELKEGDVLRVSYGTEQGTLGLSIGQGKETPIYTGNLTGQGFFTVTAHSSGTYTIRVDAQKAAGYLDVTNLNYYRG